MSSPCSLYFLLIGSLGSKNKYIREPGRGSIAFSDRLRSNTRMTFVNVGFRGGIIDTTSPKESHGICRLLLCPPTKLLKEHQQASPKYCQVHKTLIVTRFWGSSARGKNWPLSFLVLLED